MTEPAESFEFALTGSPALARDTVAAALGARGFTVAWIDEWTGTASKGSKTKQALLGAFAPFFQVGLNVFAHEGATILRITRPSAGFTSGMAGRARIKKQFTSLRTELTEVFQANGVLLPPTSGAFGPS